MSELREPRRRESVEIRRAEMEPLTAYDDEFFIEAVEEGQDVPIGASLAKGQFFLRCDFENITDPRFQSLTPQKMHQSFEKHGKLEEQFPEMDEKTRLLVFACWKASQLAHRLLGNLASETERNNSLHRYATQTPEGKNVCVKPLSEAKNEAVCSEFSLVTQEILSRLGVEAAVVVGAFASNVDAPLLDRHTYVALKKGELVYDPSHSIPRENQWPPVVLKPEKPVTVENLRDMGTDPELPTFGHRMVSTDIVTGGQRVYGSGAT